MTAATPKTELEIVGAVILAGGRARRMGGGDKGFSTLCGRTIIEHVIDRLHAQSIGAPPPDRLAVNANGDPSRFSSLALPVIPDPVSGHPGPLAGVLAAVLWAAANGLPIGADAPRPVDGIYVATVACDTPFLPSDLFKRLKDAVESGVGKPPGGPWPIACARSHGRRHPVAALWPLAVADALRAAIGSGQYRVGDFLDHYPTVVAEYGRPSIDPFLNINTPDDLDAAVRLMGCDET